MEEQKSAITSKTIQGNVVTLISIVALCSQQWGGVSADETTVALTSFAAAVGAVYSIFGRLVATTKITSWFK